MTGATRSVIALVESGVPLVDRARLQVDPGGLGLAAYLADTRPDGPDGR